MDFYSLQAIHECKKIKVHGNLDIHQAFPGLQLQSNRIDNKSWVIKQQIRVGDLILSREQIFYGFHGFHNGFK